MSKTKNEGLRKYELMLVIKSTLPDAQRKQALTKIKDMIKEWGGSVEEENAWGKRVFAFPVMKQTEGFYIVYNILLGAEHTGELKRQLTINGDVLRYLLRNVEEFEKISVPVKVESTEK